MQPLLIHITDSTRFESAGLPFMKAPQIARDEQLITATPNSYGSYQRLLKTNPQLAQQALQTQWQNSLAIIGNQVLPVLVPLMVKFANDLGQLSQWMQRNPGTAKHYAEGVIGLAAAFKVFGVALEVIGVAKLVGLSSILKNMGGGGGGTAAAGTAPGLLGESTRIAGRFVLYGALYETLDELLPDSGGWMALHTWSNLRSAIQGWKSRNTHVSPYATASDVGKTIQVTTQANLDGRRVGAIESEHQRAPRRRRRPG